MMRAACALLVLVLVLVFAGCDLYPVTNDAPVVTGLGRSETSVRPWR